MLKGMGKAHICQSGKVEIDVVASVADRGMDIARISAENPSLTGSSGELEPH